MWEHDDSDQTTSLQAQGSTNFEEAFRIMDTDGPLHEAREKLEKAILKAAIESFSTWTKVEQVLRIARSTLYKKRKRYDL